MQIAFIFGTVVAGLVGVLLAIFLAPFLVAPQRKTRRRKRKNPKNPSNLTAPKKPVRDPSSISAPTDTATIYYSPFEQESVSPSITESTRTRRNFGQRPFTRPAGTATQSGSTLTSDESAAPSSKYVPPALRRLQARKEKEQTVKVYLEERAAKATVAKAAPTPKPAVEKTEDPVMSAPESTEVATTRWGKEGWVWQRGGKPVEVSLPAAVNNRWQRSPRASVSEPSASVSPIIESEPEADAAPEPVAIRLDPRLLDAFAQFKEDEDTKPTPISTDKFSKPNDLVIDPRLLKAFENFQKDMESPSIMSKNLNAGAAEFKPRSFQFDPAAPAFDMSFAS